MDDRGIKVSVVIPIYNVEKYVEACLQSVMEQTLQEIEIICVNDGSLDKSAEIVERLMKEDKRIRLISKENGGLSSARNVGMTQAVGKYLYFLDSDDMLLGQEALEQLYEISEKNHLDAVCFGAVTVYENNVAKRRYAKRFEGYYHRKNVYPEPLTGCQMLLKLWQNGEYRTSACLQMSRTEYLRQHDIVFYEGILHEDNLFSLQVMLDAERVMVINQDYYVRMIRENSIMTTEKRILHSWGYFVCLRQLLQFLGNRKFDEDIRKCMGDILSVIQRDAVNAVQGMKEDEIISSLSKEVNIEDQIAYSLLIINVISKKRRRTMPHKILQKMRRR